MISIMLVERLNSVEEGIEPPGWRQWSAVLPCLLMWERRVKVSREIGDAGHREQFNQNGDTCSCRLYFASPSNVTFRLALMENGKAPREPSMSIRIQDHFFSSLRFDDSLPWKAAHDTLLGTLVHRLAKETHGLGQHREKRDPRYGAHRLKNDAPEPNPPNYLTFGRKYLENVISIYYSE